MKFIHTPEYRKLSETERLQYASLSDLPLMLVAPDIIGYDPLGITGATVVEGSRFGHHIQHALRTKRQDLGLSMEQLRDNILYLFRRVAEQPEPIIENYEIKNEEEKLKIFLSTRWVTDAEVGQFWPDAKSQQIVKTYRNNEPIIFGSDPTPEDYGRYTTCNMDAQVYIAEQEKNGTSKLPGGTPAIVAIRKKLKPIAKASQKLNEMLNEYGKIGKLSLEDKIAIFDSAELNDLGAMKFIYSGSADSNRSDMEYSTALLKQAAKRYPTQYSNVKITDAEETSSKNKYIERVKLILQLPAVTARHSNPNTAALTDNVELQLLSLQEEIMHELHLRSDSDTLARHKYAEWKLSHYRTKNNGVTTIKNYTASQIVLNRFFDHYRPEGSF